jgi:Carboxypeptidase regulatory-like domain/TonB-dependent Receptor Plug Domain/TonB dependent receptor
MRGWTQAGGNSSWLKALVVLTMGIFLALPSYAQVAGATLTGTVNDPSGAAVPNAQVAIKNVSTGVVRTVTTDSQGFYTAPNLLPGSYEVTTSAPGFSTEVRSGITLTVGAQQLLNIPMQVGQVAQQVKVTGEAPSVELTTSSIGGEVNQTTLRELPLNGRDWTQLASLQPGVNAVATQDPIGTNATRGTRGFGNQMTISGTRPQMNNYRLDGVSIVDYAGGAPGSVLGLSLGVDAIGEFSVLTSNYSAEYGRTSGGVINAITRSGSNEFHGSAYEFLRNSALDARNYFDGATIPPFKRNQFGGTIGGPIVKDKVFFFFDYEGLRENLGVTNVDLAPSANARMGILNNSGGAPPTIITVSPLVQPYLAFWPVPTSSQLIGLGNTGKVPITTQNPSSENFYTGRIDGKISATDSIFGTFLHDSGINDAPDSLNNWLIGNTGDRDVLVLEETHLFSSTLVNSLRGGYNRVVADSNQGLQTINSLANDPSLGTFAGRPAPGITVPGLTKFIGGLNSLPAPFHTWNSFQAYDDAFLTKGVHSLKFGAAVEYMQDNQSVTSNINGLFSFGSLQKFLTDQPNTFKGQVPNTFTEFGVRQTLFGAYLQDDWKVRSNLTLNLGLRYEMVTVPTEVHNRLANLRSFSNPTPSLGSPLFENPTLHNFEPRIGFAWDPFRKGTTAVRGAFGFFDVLPLNYEFYNAEASSFPFSQSLSGAKLPANSFPTDVTNIVVPSQKFLASSFFQFNPKRNYVMIWNLNVQQELTPSTTLTVGYVGNHGVHMLNRTDDGNDVLPTVTPQGLLWPSPTGSGTVVNPANGQIRGMFWTGSAYYNALQVQVNKKYSHGFQVQGSYTWAKGIDSGSASVVGDPFANSISSPFWFCTVCRRGLSDFDIGQTLVINYIWQIPGPKDKGAVVSHLLGGWQFGGILTAESGSPFTPLISGDPLGLNNSDPFAFPNRLTGPGCHSAVNPGNPNDYIKTACFAAPNPLTLLGNAGRNSLIGPGLVTLDLSLVKNNYIPKISEAFNVQFRVEAFNSLNRSNFAPPIDNDALFDQTGAAIPAAGLIDTTSTPARQMQFGLKVIF